MKTINIVGSAVGLLFLMALTTAGTSATGQVSLINGVHLVDGQVPGTETARVVERTARLHVKDTIRAPHLARGSRSGVERARHR